MPKHAIGFAPTGSGTADVVLLADDVCTLQVLGADVRAVSGVLDLAGIDPWKTRDAFATLRPSTLSEGDTAFAVFEISGAAYRFLRGKK